MRLADIPNIENLLTANILEGKSQQDENKDSIFSITLHTRNVISALTT